MLAISAHLDYGDLLGSLKQVDVAFKEAGLNLKASMGLLRRPVMAFPDLAKFVLLHSGTDYASLESVIKSLVIGRQVLRFHGVLHVLLPPKNVVQKERQNSKGLLEIKVDPLTNQTSQLALMMKKTQTMDRRNDDDQV